MDTTYQFVPILIVGFAAALGLTPVSRHIAMRLGVVDKPTLPRKLHKDNKPMMGGLAIYSAALISVMVFSPPQHLRELAAIMGGAGLLVIVGGLDDRYHLSVRVRLVANFLAALIVVLAGIQIRLFNQPLIDVPLTLVWIVALVNAANFLDNMDGLTAGYSAIACGFFLLIALAQGQVLVALLAAAVFGSALGFLAYNFSPSSTFMGDMGALALGFMQAVLAIKLQFGTQPLSVTWMIPLLVLALPVFDINLVVWTRLWERRSPFEGGRDHTSHRIMALGFSQRVTILIIYGGCVVYGALGLLISHLSPEAAGWVGAFSLSLLGILAIVMVWIRERVQKRPAHPPQG
ncbi:MAG: MraY family glycosyltransferase [Anaerolineae bacterium]